MTDDETIALRVTVIGGQRYPDDFTVIVRASGVSSDKVQWSWNCYLHGAVAWRRERDRRRSGRLQGEVQRSMGNIRAGRTDEEIARTNRYAEALARYDRKGGK
jgi:hypothetical protein